MLTETDVIVIGGGIAGAGVAAELAGERRVVLLEAEERPGMHTTGRSVSVHSETYGSPCVRLLSRGSRDHFLEGVDGRSFASDRGCLYLATEAQIERLDAFGGQPTVAPSIERIGEAEIRSLNPLFRPGVVVAALYERHAYSLDVDAIHAAYLKRYRRAGGVLECSAGVAKLEYSGGQWMAEAGSRNFRAPVVVNAAGAWGDVVAGMAGVQPIGLQPMRRTVALVDAPTGVDPSRWPLAIDIDEQFYFKPDAGKIILSPADETPMDPCDAWTEDVDVAIAVDRVQQVIDLPVHRVAHSWAGLRTFAPDRTPVAGFDRQAPGFFWLVGQGGYGIQTAPALSRFAAAMVCEQGMPSDLAEFGLQAADLASERFACRE
ncbi:FAD-dependent oxidoreductase [Sphingopyxis lindanitolerans]|uniref:FAD-dependent oxidoreductase n=1 Tax=Sphingopyxis lindanitolerans TaxID=2054227 RepID=A0A2S8BAR6_9SPHN|nr:FAD-binding oxidoreductase [Sphingopyxis lindanitolerans]PQM29501.1 FAD-dependent oxidoreductase [Sphingopyxis lindanitolerans]